MKHTDFAALRSHPASAALVPSSYSERVHEALRHLEATLMSGERGKILLLLEHDLMEELTFLAIDRLLRYTSVRHLLLLVPPKRKGQMIEAWNNAVAWSNGRKLAEQFSLLSAPSLLRDQITAELCIATIIDIQKHVGVDVTLPFFKAFDIVLAYEVPACPGPAWIQAVDCFAFSGARIIGLSSTLSEEDGTSLFGCVIDQKRTSDQIQPQA
jgi:hypothetical protein